MFLLISFALANNYCIETINGSCEQICKNLPRKFDNIFSYIPSNDELNASNDDIHNFYIANNVAYSDSPNNFIFCDPSIHLIYSESFTTISIKDHIYIDSNKRLKDAPILFKISNNFNNNIYIEVDTDEKNNTFQVIFETDYSFSNYHLAIPKFYTENFPENLISISTNSEKITFNEITANIEKVFNDTTKLIGSYIPCYCISEKENKCSDYQHLHPIIINSSSYIHHIRVLLIVETTIPQVIRPDLYCHIVAMPGSEIIFYANEKDETYAILHSDSVEISKLYFKGMGSLTLALNTNLSFLTTTSTINYKFGLKSSYPLNFNQSNIRAIKENIDYNLNEKIHVPEYSLFTGPKCLSGLFEKGKFLSYEEEFVHYNVTEQTLKEYDYDYVIYYFDKGDHEIPRAWKSSCRFHGIDPNNTNFIFSDVVHFNGYSIDSYIDVNYPEMPCQNRITIKPAEHFYLSAFGEIYSKEYNLRYTIVVDKDFYMDGFNENSNFDDDEMDHDQCKIIGNGTIKFSDPNFLKTVQNFCQIDENVHLVNSTSSNYFYGCLGQSDINKCKSEIDGVENLVDYHFIWLRNFKSILTMRDLYHFSNIYITDKVFYFGRSLSNYQIVLTANSDLSVYYWNLDMDKDEVNYIKAQSKTAKLTFWYHFNSNFNNHGLKYLDITYDGSPEFDFQIYFYYETAVLSMKYVKNYIPGSFQLNGKCALYVRETYLKMLPIFKCPDSIVFPLNYDSDYAICFSDEPEEVDSLKDFVLCNTSEKFLELDQNSLGIQSAYIFKDISLFFNSACYRTTSFKIFNNVTVNIDTSNNDILRFKHNYLVIYQNYYDRNYDIYYSGSINLSLIFNLKEITVLDISRIYKEMPNCAFKSSLDSIEIIPSLSSIDFDFKIDILGDFSVTSPAPSYISKIITNSKVSFSPRWSYLFLSEDSKKFYESNPYSISNNIDNDINLLENVVIAVGNDDILQVPNWSNFHKVFILQDFELLIDKPSNLTYHKDGIIINNNFKIIVGNMNIIVPANFTVNAYYSLSFKYNFIYNAILNCSENEYTNLFTGNLYVTQYFDYYNERNIKIYGYSEDNPLTINARNHSQLYYLQDVMTLNSDSGVFYHFEYNYICYCSYNSETHCPGNNYIVSSLSALYSAINDLPYLPILIGSDIDIYSTTGNHLVLNTIEDNIEITLPDSPESMTILENKTIRFNYSDSTIIDIANKSVVFVDLTNSLEININSNTETVITFILKSDVFVKTESAINADFMILVETTSYHLYTEEKDKFGNLFGDSLEQYIKMCAYDSDSSSHCTFEKKDLIENIFKEPFNCNELEIALSSQPIEIELPSITKKIDVNILPISTSAILTIKNVSNLQISPFMTIVNDLWRFAGDRKVLSFRLDQMSTLSIINTITVPISLHLTSNQSFIDLRDCNEQSAPQITIHKYGNETNEITIFGPNETYHNFLSSLVDYDGITFIHNGTQKYHCICNDEISCERCKIGVEGIIITSDKINNDPGQNSNIRVFSDFEITSNLFNNEHNVFIDEKATLNLTDVDTIYQNLEEGLKIDNLIFVNGTNLFLKPRNLSLNIVMRKKEPGPYFYMEIDKFLKLNVPNIEDEEVQASRIHVEGRGELNVYDYPFNRIRPGPYVKVIKGIYIICNSKSGSSYCTYQAAYAGYKNLGNSDDFKPDFDPDSKIIVFLNTYTNNIDANLEYLQGQKVQFDRNILTSKSLLEGQSKVRFINTTNLTNYADLTTELGSSFGGATLDNADSDLFVVGFDENLTIKQEGDFQSDLQPITIQPMSDDVTVIIDDSVDIGKQKIKIETEAEKDKRINVKVVMNKNFTKEDLKNFLETDENKVSVTLENSTSKNEKNKLPIGAIVGIVVGCIVIVSLIVLIIVFIVKKKKKGNNGHSLSSDSINQFDDSTF